MSTTNTIGFIGLGRMGLAMVARLSEAGYAVHGTDVSEDARAAASTQGVTTHDTIAALVAALPTPSVVWVMVPSQFVDDVIAELVQVLPSHSTVIDGGNSDYRDSRNRYHYLAEQQIGFLDCGTSGGVDGARHGASLMVGGDQQVFAAQESLFQTLATENGYARVGGPGAGHFVKAVHNAIEYGMMGALAEGVALLHAHEFEFDISVEATLRPYEHGSVISSRLLEWLVEGYQEGLLDTISGEVPVGETEEKMKHIATLGSMPVLDAALAQRAATRELPTTTGKYIAAMRHKFGGHHTIPKQD